MKQLYSLLSLTALLCLLGTTSIQANNSWMHYSRMTTVATGKGLVYSDVNPTETPNYTAYQSVATYGSNSTDEYVVHTYHIYAQPQDGYLFKGWYTDAQCTQLLSNNEYTTFPINVYSGDQNAPSEGVAYALFEQALVNYYSRLQASAVGQGSVAISSTKTTHPSYNTEADATTTNGRTTHTYFIFARAADKNTFDGWYSDAKCTKLISTEASYTYTIETNSTEEQSPQQEHIYAHFSPNADQYYELGNSGFEEWEGVDGGQEPKQWSSFLTATGSMAGMVKAEQLKQSTDAHSGQYSAQITARNVMFGIIAQGNLTTGCINGGSTNATDASGNYNYTNEETGQAMRFTGRPDAMRVWIKSQCSGTVKIAAMLHAKGYYQDPNTANTDRLSHLVGQASLSPESNGGVWTEYTVPFSYASEETSDRPYYALVSFATNSTPGKGSASDVMYVDDIRMVYNSELKSLSMDGHTIRPVNGRATYSGTYKSDRLDITLTGAGASYTADYNEETSTLLITVYGDNYSEDASNKHEYSIYFEGGEEPIITPDDMYPINFEPTAERTNTFRSLEAISLTEQDHETLLLDINSDYPYNDMTDVIYSVSDQGLPIAIDFNYTDSRQEATWMHSYAYIDLDQNGLFDTKVNTADHTVEGDLMAYSFYSFGTDDSEGYNSLGNYITGDDRNVLDLPTFRLPTKPGIYRMRLKIDWNSIDPAGDTQQGILTNGGYIVDLTLEVVDSNPVPEGIDLMPNVNLAGSNACYDLQGRRLNTRQHSLQRGVVLQQGRKFIR